MFVYRRKQLKSMHLQSCEKHYDRIRNMSNRAPPLLSVTSANPSPQHRLILLISLPICTWHFARWFRSEYCPLMTSARKIDGFILFVNFSTGRVSLAFAAYRSLTFDFSAKRSQPETLSPDRHPATASVITLLNSYDESH